MDRCLDQQKYLGTKWAISISIFVLLFRIEKVTIANEFKTCKQEPPITMVENLMFFFKIILILIGLNQCCFQPTDLLVLKII